MSDTPLSGQDTTPARATLPGAGSVLDDRFRLDARIGSGGLGSVWRATDLNLQREVAIKLLHPHLAARPDVAERFRIEALAAARLSHPNVLRVYDAGVDNGNAYLVTELIDGRGVDRLIGRGPIEPTAVAAIGAQAASALDEAHRAGMIHRDVKPSNLLLHRNGRIKLIDFGVARVVDLASDLTIQGETVGSWAYLAPEQLDDQPVGFSADVYALGLVLWEACTGHTPFHGETPSALALARLTQQVPELPELPELPDQLRQVVDAATAREPEDRPDAATIVETLTKLTGPRPHHRLLRMAQIPSEDGDAPETAGSEPAGS